MSNLIIVDKNKFSEEMKQTHSDSAIRSATFALSYAQVKGEDALEQYILQEKCNNDKLLDEQNRLLKRNEKYQKLIERLSEA